MPARQQAAAVQGRSPPASDSHPRGAVRNAQDAFTQEVNQKKLPMTKTIRIALLLAFLGSGATIVNGAQPSSYAGQEKREIKALSSEDVATYLEGKGMGLAKAAELNHYPGPVHVLALGSELGLTPDQRARTEMMFKKMETEP